MSHSPPSNEGLDFLRAWVHQGHAESFRRVVGIYAPMVRASAKRCLGPFAHLSDDVAQTVFVMLAGKAARLATPGFQPGPWLYRHYKSGGKPALTICYGKGMDHPLLP